MGASRPSRPSGSVSQSRHICGDRHHMWAREGSCSAESKTRARRGGRPRLMSCFLYFLFLFFIFLATGEVWRSPRRRRQRTPPPSPSPTPTFFLLYLRAARSIRASVALLPDAGEIWGGEECGSCGCAYGILV